MGASLKSPEKAHFPSPLLTERASVRILFEEAEVSHFGILLAVWLTQQWHLLGKEAKLVKGWPLSSTATSPVVLPKTARRRRFKGGLSESPSTSARLVNARLEIGRSIGRNP